MIYGTMHSRAKTQMGDVQSTTFLNPGWYTASPKATERNIQIMRDSLRRSV